MSDSPILTVEEAAAVLKVTPRWLMRSHCPRIRAGGKVRDLKDARRWDALGLVSSGEVPLARLYEAFGRKDVDGFIRDHRSPLWETLVDLWASELDVREQTRTMYTMQVRAILPAGARVHAITATAIRSALMALDLSAATRRNYLAAVQSFCAFLVAYDYLPVDPTADQRKVPRPKKGKPRTVWMTAKEDERLCLAAPSPLREYFALVHGTGAERNAALAMTRADIDLERGECHIPGTKAEGRDRYGIPIDPWALAILRPYVKTILTGPLFPTLNKWAVNRGHQDARTAAGLPGYQLRDARHSVAVRWLVADHVPIWDVAERLGHADMTMAVKVYTKTMLREAAKRLGVDTVEPHVEKTRAQG